MRNSDRGQLKIVRLKFDCVIGTFYIQLLTLFISRSVVSVICSFSPWILHIARHSAKIVVIDYYAFHIAVFFWSASLVSQLRHSQRTRLYEETNISVLYFAIVNESIDENEPILLQEDVRTW